MIRSSNYELQAEEGLELSTETAGTSETFVGPFISDKHLEQRRTSVFYLTNRMNLNGILSSRVIGPLESYGKYYSDLLEQVPGWVPLFRTLPGSEALGVVTAERGCGAPVLIEFPGSVAKRAVKKDSMLFVTALALSEAHAIHFISNKELRAHQARRFNNIHEHDDLIRVSPHFFPDFEAGVGVLEVTHPDVATPKVDWVDIDRVRGALSASLAAADTGDRLGITASVFGTAKLPVDVKRPKWLSWEEISKGSSTVRSPLSGHEDPDYIGFRLAYEVLGQRNSSDAWNPSGILADISGRIADLGLPEESRRILDLNLGRVQSILDAEVDFTPFRSSSRALVSSKALLLTLLRPDLGELLSWSTDETGADDVTRTVAALLAGRARGVSREATVMRSRLLDDLTARWAARQAADRSGLGRVTFVGNSRRAVLKVDGLELASRGGLTPDPLQRYRKVSESRRASVRVKVSRALGWPVDYRIRVPEGAVVERTTDEISVVSSLDVVVDARVAEDVFVERLSHVSGEERNRANLALSARREV